MQYNLIHRQTYMHNDEIKEEFTSKNTSK